MWWADERVLMRFRQLAAPSCGIPAGSGSSMASSARGREKDGRALRDECTSASWRVVESEHPLSCLTCNATL